MKSPKRGFTIVELLIAIFIISLLSSVAVPSVDKYLRKTKTSEAMMGVNHVFNGVVSYKEEMLNMTDATGAYVFDWSNDNCHVFPYLYSRRDAGAPFFPQGREKIFFLNPAGCASDPCCAYQPWTAVGISFDTQYMNYRYLVTADPDYASEAKDGKERATFRVTAQGDTDADGTPALFIRSGWADDQLEIHSTYLRYSDPLE